MVQYCTDCPRFFKPSTSLQVTTVNLKATFRLPTKVYMTELPVSNQISYPAKDLSQNHKKGLPRAENGRSGSSFGIGSKIKERSTRRPIHNAAYVWSAFVR